MRVNTTERAEKLAAQINCKLAAEEARDLTDETLTRCLAPCVAGMSLVKAARQLRDAGLLKLHN